MGVKNLWKILEPCGKRVSLDHKTLGVDISIWMYQYRTLPTSLVVFSFCRRLFRILYNKIKPVFIFDGKPPLAKLRILDERKKANLRLLLKRYITNKNCEVCGESLRTCKHFNKEDFEALNAKAFEKMKNHEYNWGDLSDEDELDEYFEELSIKSKIDSNYQNKKRQTDASLNSKQMTSDDLSVSALRSEQVEQETSKKNSNAQYMQSQIYFDTSIANFDQNSLINLSKTRQLSLLIDLRLKRKLPMFCDSSNSANFSNSQIENVKKRNHITTLIRNLNQESNKIIRSDSSTKAILSKEKEIFQNFCYLDDHKVTPFEENKKIINEVETIEDLFDAYQTNKWESEYEKYKDSSLKDDTIDQKIKKNKLLLNEFLENKIVQQPGLPTFKQESLSTNRKMLQELETEDSSDQANVGNSDSFDKINGKPSDSFDQVNVNTSDSSDFDFLDKYLMELSEEEPYDFGKSTIPSNKMSLEMANLEQSNDSDLKRIKSIIIEILRVFELPFIESIGEADSQCWSLYKKGLIDGVITEDSDMIIYGTTVYKNFFRKDKDILEFAMKEVESTLNLSKNDLIKLGYLLGSDYCEGQKGIGVKRAIEKIATVSDLDISFLQEIYSEDKNMVEIARLEFGALHKIKFHIFLLEKGLDKIKIDELMLYMKKVQEIMDQD